MSKVLTKDLDDLFGTPGQAGGDLGTTLDDIFGPREKVDVPPPKVAATPLATSIPDDLSRPTTSREPLPGLSRPVGVAGQKAAPIQRKVPVRPAAPVVTAPAAPVAPRAGLPPSVSILPPVTLGPVPAAPPIRTPVTLPSGIKILPTAPPVAPPEPAPQPGQQDVGPIQHALGAAARVTGNIPADVAETAAILYETARQDLLERAPLLSPTSPGAQRPPIVNPLYQAAQDIREQTARAFPQNPELEASFWLTTVPQGLASLTTTLMAGAAGGMPGAMSVGSIQMADQAYREAFEATQDPKKATKAFVINALIGTTEAVPAMDILKRMNHPAMRGAIRKWLIDAGLDAVEEGVQEGVQQFLTNVDAALISGYDPNRPLPQGVLESMAAGGVVGGLAGGVLGGVAPRPTPAAPVMTPRERAIEDIREQEREALGAPPTAPIIQPEPTPGPAPTDAIDYALQIRAKFPDLPDDVVRRMAEAAVSGPLAPPEAAPSAPPAPAPAPPVSVEPQPTIGEDLDKIFGPTKPEEPLPVPEAPAAVPTAPTPAQPAPPAAVAPPERPRPEEPGEVPEILFERGVRVPPEDRQVPIAETRTTPRGTTVYVSKLGMAAVKYAAGADPLASSYGMTFPEKELPELAARLQKLTESRAFMEVGRALDEARAVSVGLPVQFVVREGRLMSELKATKRHEQNHLQLLRDRGINYGSVIDQDLAADPDYRAAAANIRSEYPDLVSRPYEIAAFAAAGQFDRLGVTPDVGQRLFEKIVGAVERAGGIEKALTTFAQSHPTYKRIIDDVKARATAAAGRRTPTAPGERTAGISEDVREGAGREVLRPGRPLEERPTYAAPLRRTQVGRRIDLTKTSTQRLEAMRQAADLDTLAKINAELDRRARPRPEVPQAGIPTPAPRTAVDEAALLFWNQPETQAPGRATEFARGVAEKPIKGLEEKARKRPSIERALTEKERKGLSDKDRAALYREFDKLPPDKDFEAAAQRGAIAKHWYENSARAFNEIFGKDAPQFVKLMAALSPQRPVRDNLRGALRVWDAWLEAGRPTDPNVIRGILDAAGERLPSRVGNAVRALRGEPMSGPKVGSFYPNLRNSVSAVTNDVWMARFAGVVPALLGNKVTYLALSAKVRKAAQALGWTPRQAQAGTWAFTKALWELGIKGKPIRELLKTDPVQAENVADFARIMVTDQEIRGLINEILQRKGQTIEDVEGRIAPKLGRQEGARPPISEATTRRFEEGVERVRAERAEAKLAKAEAAGQPRLGFEEKAAPPEDAVAALLAADKGNFVAPSSQFVRGFISRDGQGINTALDHLDALRKAGLIEEGDTDYDWGRALEPSGLIRAAYEPGAYPEIMLAIGRPPTGLQRSYIRSFAEKHPRAKFVYDLYRDGKHVKSRGDTTIEDFMKDVSAVYQLGLSPRELRPLEAGVLRLGGRKPENPLPNDPKYTTIFKKQHEAGQSHPLTALIDAARSLGEGRIEAIRRYMDRWVDVKKIVQDAQKRGVLFTPGQDPYIALQLEFGGGSGWAEATLIDSQRIVAKSEELGVRDQLEAYLNLKGNLRAIKVVQEHIRDLRAAGHAAAANRAQVRLNNNQVAAAGYTEAELNAALRELERANPGKWADIERLAKEEFRHNRLALDAYHREGIISDGLYNKLVSRGDEYVNMSRIMDLIDDERASHGATMTLRQQHGIKELTGSERVNQNPFVADVENRAIMYRDISRNRAARKLVEFAGADPQGFGTVVRKLPSGQTFGTDEGGVVYHQGGKPVTYAVPKAIADALQLASDHEVRMLGGAALGLTARAFRSTTTALNLGFAVPNLFRDYADTRAFIGKTYNPADMLSYVGDLSRALQSIRRKDDDYLKFLRSGAAYSTLQKRINGQQFLEIDRVFGRRLLDLATKPLTTIGEINNVVEELSKVAAYNYMRRNGVNPTEAAARARQFAGTPDVGNAGNMGPSLNNLLMFFSASIKGIERSFIFMKKNPKKFAALVFAALLRELIMNRWNESFESPEGDGSREWDHVSDNDKKNYYVVLTSFVYQTPQGSKRLLGIKLARPHFLGKMLGGPALALWEGISGKVDVPQAALDAASNIMPGQFSLEKEALASSAARGVVSSLNPLLQEPIEQVSNREMFTDVPIVPERMRQREDVFQYDERTSPTAIKIGKLFDRLGARGPITSPKRIEHAIRGVTSGFGEMITSGLDYLQKLDRPVYPLEAPEAVSRVPVFGPVTRRFLASPADQVQIDKERAFYQMLDQGEEATTTLGQLYEQASEREMIVKRYRDLPELIVLASAHPELTRLARTFSDIRESITRVAKDPALSDQDKRALVRAAHEDYQILLGSVPQMTADLERIQKKDLSKDPVIWNDANGNPVTWQQAIEDILERNRNLNPEPSNEENEETPR